MKWQWSALNRGQLLGGRHARSERRSMRSLKSRHTVIGDGDTMVLPDVPATIFEGEAEVALIIAKRACVIIVPPQPGQEHVSSRTPRLSGVAIDHTGR